MGYINESGISHLWPLIFFESLCLLIAIPIFPQILCTIYSSPAEPRKPRKTSLFAVASFIMCLIGSILINLHMNPDGELPNTAIVAILESAGIATWFCGQVSIYIILFLNLYYSFKDTQFNLPDIYIGLIPILIFVFLLLRIVYTIFVALYIMEIISTKAYVIALVSVDGCAEGLDLILSILLCYLFVIRLKRLNDQNRLNQRNVIHLARKYRILSIIFIVSFLSCISSSDNDKYACKFVN